MDSPKATNNFVCRICNENGFYDLCEMKFCCNDSDVLLIDAFNSFSTLNNVSIIFVCFLLMLFIAQIECATGHTHTHSYQHIHSM